MTGVPCNEPTRPTCLAALGKWQILLPAAFFTRHFVRFSTMTKPAAGRRQFLPQTMASGAVLVSGEAVAEDPQTPRLVSNEYLWWTCYRGENLKFHRGPSRSWPGRRGGSDAELVRLIPVGFFPRGLLATRAGRWL